MEEGKEEVRERHTYTQTQTVRDGDREKVRVRECVHVYGCMFNRDVYVSMFNRGSR